MLHTHSFIFAFPESWIYLTYQHSFHNHRKLKLSNISTFIYTFLHYYLCCSTHILFCITVMHEDLPSQDCIVLIITVYSHNIYQKHKNSIKLKNWFQPQHIFHAFIIHNKDRERESVKHTIWLFIYLYLMLVMCRYSYVKTEARQGSSRWGSSSETIIVQLLRCAEAVNCIHKLKANELLQSFHQHTCWDGKTYTASSLRESRLSRDRGWEPVKVSRCLSVYSLPWLTRWSRGKG